MALYHLGTGFNGEGFGSNDDQVNLAQSLPRPLMRCTSACNSDLPLTRRPSSFKRPGVLFPPREHCHVHDSTQVPHQQTADGAGADDAYFFDLFHLNYFIRR